VTDGDDSHDEYLSSLSEEEIRYLAENMWSEPLRGRGLRWLQRRREEERSLSEASTSEQIRLARDANQIAKHARNAAIAALVVATIGTIATIIGWFIR
jgi:hypothetical protein